MEEKVVIVGLKHQTELNGLEGRVKHYTRDGRAHVYLMCDGTERCISIRVNNIKSTTNMKESDLQALQQITSLLGLKLK